MSAAINRLPLNGLPSPFASARRMRALRADDLRELLKAAPVRFLVANIGHTLRQIEVRECFDFWKSEVGPHLADPDGARLEYFPGSYCYFASEWSHGDGPIVLLEVAH